VLKLDSADQFRNFVPRAERGRPIRHREPGVVAGDQRTGNDEKKCPAGEYYGEPVMPTVVRYFNGFQSSAPRDQEGSETIADVPNSRQSRLQRLSSLLCDIFHLIKPAAAALTQPP
jgi:hypothetical protein